MAYKRISQSSGISVKIISAYLINLEIYLNVRYEISHMKLPKPKLLHSWDSATALTKWEWNRTNTNLFKSISNNIAPFVSIK